MTDIGAELARMRKDIERLQRAARLSFASLDDTALEVRDSGGSLRAQIGQQGDGTTAVNVVNGPPPPAPSAPIVASVLGGVTVSWDGVFADGAVIPLDWSRVEVHASREAIYTPTAATLKATVETAQGCTVVIATDDPVYVQLVARSTSGTASAPSTTAGPAGPTPVVATDILDGIVTTVKLADDAITAAKVATGAIGTTKITDNAITTPKIVAAAIQAAQIDTDAVNASKIAAGAVTTAKLDALAVTADKVAANAITTGKIAAGAVTTNALTVGIAQSIATKITDSMGDATLWATTIGTGTWSVLSGVTDAAAGGTVIQGQGPVTIERVDNTPYDPDTLYRVTARVRTTAAPTTGMPVVSIGLVGVAADAITRVSSTGANNAVTGQHYLAANGVTINVGTSWTTFTGYVQGTAATGTTTACPLPTAPGRMHSNTRYVRPSVRLLTGATGGTMQIDQVTVETVPTGVVNSVNIANGAVTAASIAADAITGKTITGGTITGTTVTGSIVRTGATGTRLEMGPSAGGTNIPGLALYSGAAAETSPGLLWSTVVNVGATPQPMTAVQAPYVDSGSAHLDLTSPAVGKGGQFKVATSSTRDYAYITGKDGAAAGPSLLELWAQNGDGGASSVLQVKGDEIYMRSAALTANGIFTAQNIAFGSVTVTTTTGSVPASALVSGLNVAGTTFRAFVTAASGVPGTQLLGVSANGQSAGGLTVWLNRTNTGTTTVWWLLIGI
ncbi:hypothetical protein [Streptomyces sp. NPDC088135]|uniref:hypothetical protein n=1 Tax=Streptomyces sp. NPDC088135 TaxID=3160993 RepID=UPI003416EA80